MRWVRGAMRARVLVGRRFEGKIPVREYGSTQSKLWTMQRRRGSKRQTCRVGVAFIPLVIISVFLAGCGATDRMHRSDAAVGALVPFAIVRVGPIRPAEANFRPSNWQVYSNARPEVEICSRGPLWQWRSTQTRSLPGSCTSRLLAVQGNFKTFTNYKEARQVENFPCYHL